MTNLSRISLAALVGSSLLAMASSSASARIVCNGDGDCWHAHQDYAYRPEFGLTIHPDNWRWKHSEHFAWKEHEGRGYWHGGEWKEF